MLRTCEYFEDGGSSQFALTMSNDGENPAYLGMNRVVGTAWLQPHFAYFGPRRRPRISDHPIQVNRRRAILYQFLKEIFNRKFESGFPNVVNPFSAFSWFRLWLTVQH